VLALAGLLAACAVAGAGNWPRFRGPNGSGVAADKDVPVTWTADKGVLWKVDLPGTGNSSPVIWGDRLFLQSATPRERLLLCLDANTGKVLWKRSAPGGTARIHKLNSLASGTPATDGRHVYCTFWDGKDQALFAYDFKGDLLWKQDLGRFESQHGAGHSPMLYKGLVILNYDQDGAAVLLAFDGKTGKEVWRAERKAYRACYSTPMLREKAGGDTELLVISTAGVTGYDPATGKEGWNYKWTVNRMPLRTVASPIVAAGLIIANAGDGGGDRHAVAVKLGGTGDVSATHLAWENKKTLPYVPCMLAQGDYLYSVNDKGTAACHEAKTGKEVWSERLARAFTASPILVDGKVYAVDEDGVVYVFKAATTFTLLAKNAMGEQVLATPAVADNKLYVRGKNHLYCIGKQPAVKGQQGKVRRAATAAVEDKKVDTRVFELRIYTAYPGKMDALHARFRDHTNALFKKHGMTIIGFWTPLAEKGEEKKLYYVLAFPSKEAADKSWKAFREDPEWKKAKDASEKDGPLVKNVESVPMKPTDYSPLK
jgi:outer membrane protein assembly factor BamB